MGFAVVTALIAAGLSGTGGATQASAPGVTDKTVTLGYIYPATGVAASISANGVKGFEARIARQNANGGVDGRKIEFDAVDDQSSGANLTAAQNLVQSRHVFAVVNQSPFAFVTYRWLLDHGVPMIGAGTDGTYYSDKGNENVLNMAGNSVPWGDLTYDTGARAMKMLGAKKVGVLAYGAASSSVAAAKAFMNYAVPELGLDPVYTNTAVDFGTSDVSPLVLGIKNSGADSVYLPMAAATNVAVAEGLQQNGIDTKAVILATGYGQDFLDSPGTKALGPSTLLVSGFKPVELKTKATEQFQADLSKYAHFTGVPDYGMYTGYVIAEFTILALEHAGNPPTRQGLVDGAHALGTYDEAGLACQPVDVSLADRAKTPKTTCGYFLQVKNGKFVLFPKSGNPVIGKLVGSPAALKQASTGATTTTTSTTAAPG
ncbi:MAG TPA: ABC transporter substrate-binding protein [Acidimicrobiia bacterium]|nr:ABC transporter substrate-binding protein [Acidimicrobiia bacterium]